jgi:hypothetical protein
VRARHVRAAVVIILSDRRDDIVRFSFIFLAGIISWFKVGQIH